MKLAEFRLGRQFFIVLFAQLWFANVTHAAAILWTNATSSQWRVATNWSGGLPVSTSDTFITNAGGKTITVDAATATTNLTVRTLSLSAPTGFTNTLRLDNLTTNVTFRAQTSLVVGRLGVMVITNSTLQADSTFDVTAGTLTMDSGLINADFVTLRVGRAAGGSVGTFNLNGGSAKVFKLHVGSTNGSSGVFNQNGGVLNSSSVLSMGEVINSTGAVYLVSGALIATNDFTKVGNLGSGQFNQSGGTVTFAFLSVADNFNSLGALNLSAGQMTVSPRTTNDFFRVGNQGYGQFNMSGGTATVRSEFHLADDISGTGVVNITGGQFVATNDTTAIGRYGVGTMTVSNATVTLTNTSVGRHAGSSGTLNVLSNAVLNVTDTISIARFTNSVGHVFVNGGLLSLTNDSIWVGREGLGDLTISNGTIRTRDLWVAVSEDNTNQPSGTVVIAGGNTIVTSNLLVGTKSVSSGQVQIYGGNLTVAGSTPNARLTVANGSVTLNGGSLVADSVELTNNSGTFTFNGGILQAKKMTVANGAPFVVGDGVNPATLQLQGGTFNFAGGLVIATNATVTGCGNIIGAITNNGTLSTNCVTITITALTNAGKANVTVFFTSANGLTNTLEYKTNLALTNWTAILPSVLGNGGVMARTDSNAVTANRFYRIRAQ